MEAATGDVLDGGGGGASSASVEGRALLLKKGPPALARNKMPRKTMGYLGREKDFHSFFQPYGEEDISWDRYGVEIGEASQRCRVREGAENWRCAYYLS